MDLFDKCFEFSKKVDDLKSLNQFFYLREFDPTGKPIVKTKGKDMIMLGSNNYLGLTYHPKVIEATIQAIKEFGTGACSSRILVVLAVYTINWNENWLNLKEPKTRWSLVLVS